MMYVLKTGKQLPKCRRRIVVPSSSGSCNPRIWSPRPSRAVYLKTKALRYFQTSVTVYQSTGCNIPEDVEPLSERQASQTAALVWVGLKRIIGFLSKQIQPSHSATFRYSESPILITQNSLPVVRLRIRQNFTFRASEKFLYTHYFSYLK